MLYTATTDYNNSVLTATVDFSIKRDNRFIKPKAIYAKTVGGGTETVDVTVTNGTDTLTIATGVSVGATTTTITVPADMALHEDWVINLTITSATPGDDVHFGVAADIINLWNQGQKIYNKFSVTGGTPQAVYSTPANAFYAGSICIVDTSGAANNVKIVIDGLEVKSATVPANGMVFFDITDLNNEFMNIIVDAAGNCDAYLFGYRAGLFEFVK